MHRSSAVLCDPLLSIPEAARRLGVSTLIFRRLIDRGEVSHVQMGGRKRVAVSDLQSYQRRARVPARAS